ncbi:hypothetical protein LP7551_03275 [Roseibium album]|nr:hypothetical protein LP7551_03275 [Roseibium album]
MKRFRFSEEQIIGEQIIFIERGWRSLKQEAVYLEDLTDGLKA